MGDPPDDWSLWTVVRFANPDGRDRFLGATADSANDHWEAKPFAHDGLLVRVRWRTGRFQRLRDVANDYGGRVFVRGVRSWGR
jgi:hypothetical protein